MRRYQCLTLCSYAALPSWPTLRWHWHRSRETRSNLCAPRQAMAWRHEPNALRHHPWRWRLADSRCVLFIISNHTLVALQLISNVASVLDLVVVVFVVVVVARNLSHSSCWQLLWGRMADYTYTDYIRYLEESQASPLYHAFVFCAWVSRPKGITCNGELIPSHLQWDMNLRKPLGFSELRGGACDGEIIFSNANRTREVVEERQGQLRELPWVSLWDISSQD